MVVKIWFAGEREVPRYDRIVRCLAKVFNPLNSHDKKLTANESRLEARELHRSSKCPVNYSILRQKY